MKRSRNGFSIVEALMALTLLALVLVPLMSLGLGLDRQSEMDGRYEEALAAAQAGLERCRGQGFSGLDGQDIESDHGGIHVMVEARQVEPGLLRLTATATWRSVARGTARLELARLLADPDLSMTARYGLEVVP